MLYLISLNSCQNLVCLKMGVLKNLVAFLKSIFIKISTFFLVLTLAPILIMIFTPIYIFRIFVYILAKLFKRGDLGKIMDCRCAIFGHELLGEQESLTSTLVITFITEGARPLTTETASSWFSQLLEKKDENNNLKYPELKQYLSKWLGFVFWKWDKDFDLSKHVKYCYLNKVDKRVVDVDDDNNNNEIDVDEDELKNIERELVKRKFSQKTSPWEFRIVKNYKPKDAKEGVCYSAAMFKVHHGLADGYSIIKMFLLDILHLPKSSLSLPEFPKECWLTSALKSLYISLRAPFDLVSMILTPPDLNPWHSPSTPHHGNACFYTASSPSISLSELKAIKNNAGVGLKALIFSAWAGALRSTMLRKGQDVPQKLHMMSPFPLPGHPDKLRNHWSAIMVEFPTGIPDPMERLKATQAHLQSLKSSTIPLTSFAIQSLLGGLSNAIISKIAAVPIPTGLASDFPGPTTKVNTPEGLGVKDVYFSGGNPPGPLGVMFFGISYAGRWKVKVQIDGGIASCDEEAQFLADEIVAEIQKVKIGAMMEV